MKKIIIYIAIILFACSCKDYLRVEPTNVLTVKVYDDVKALLGAHLRSYNLNSSLSGVSFCHFNKQAFLVFNYYADDINMDKYLDIYTGNNNKGVFRQSMNWMQSNIPGQMWRYHYANIGFYNTIVAELGKLSGVSTEQQEIILGEARVIRAWELFKLAQYFTPYNEEKLGLPINLNADAISTFDKGRKTQTETYGIIIKELEDVLAYTTPPKESYNIFYDKKIIHALLAQIHLYKGGSKAGVKEDFAAAVAHATEAMEGRNLGTPATYNRMDVGDGETTGLFKDSSHSLLFDIRYNYPGMADLFGNASYGLLEYASDELYNLYDKNDARKDYFFTPEKGIIKFEHETSYSLYIFSIFSMAEMQLIKAEAYARGGDTPNAKLALEEFLKSRIHGFTSYTGANIIDDILIERRKEFCFEYDMRWLDLTRIQKGWSRNSQDPANPGTFTLEDNDFRFCLPLPLNEELQNNKIEQNPGWATL